ncbi:MAG: malto-oligosyltrehalose trehalohydrolase [Rhodospirillales bacterium 20-64-7]|nr:MAG: malto-oligosyltrehalose trehalohydrolase [Rhodospirillales bacterium 20-64-7]
MMQPSTRGRFGARIVGPGEVEFSLWAPEAKRVDVVLEGGAILPLRRLENGLYTGRAAAAVGTLYRYRIDGNAQVPDPASRAQSSDVHDASVVVDTAFPWTHPDWRGRPWAETVIYELHAGAFGGFAGVTEQLPRLAALGITAIELMPIADFPGRHNWGYDGALIYAPDTAYGTPRELQQLIDTAHGLGLQVFLDVVYNHFGPDGNYLNVYAKSFFREDTHTPWGNAIDFRRRPVRDFFIANALYWLQEYRFDGLRFDAVHAIEDASFLEELSATIRAEVSDRHIHLILENEENNPDLLRRQPAEQKFDAQWADDWHHCAHVLLTREREGYYGDFQNPAAQMARCLAEGFAYQGEPSAHRDGKPRGAPSRDLPPSAFVICLQNHDQIGNRALGERLHSLAHPDALRAATALLLFTPQIPMIFMGEEFGESRPFLYFTDHHDELGRLVTEGRRKEFAKFEAFSNPETRSKIPDPNDPATFEASQPKVRENGWTALFRECLALRAEHIAPRMAGCVSSGATALSAAAVRAGWRMNDASRLTVATNFGAAPVSMEPPLGELLYGPGLQDGSLPGCSTSLWLAR